jgi:hypothetical protein
VTAERHPRPRVELWIPEATTVICAPCRWGLPAVRSLMVRCVSCRTRCWLSVRAPQGALRFLCMLCGADEIERMEARGTDVDVRPAPWAQADMDERRR